jgi:hydroxymethylpyrimidine pyrophosphatase-like HAD family hydrolase
MGVAMANASDQVKNSANHVTSANTDDGFAFGIQELLSF